MNNLPHDLYTADQSRELDRIAIEELGIAGSVLMERAGKAAFRLLNRNWPEARRIVVFCGTGNNGGDGFVVARLARADDREVQVLQVGDPDKLTGDALAALQRLKGMDVFPEPFQQQALDECDLVVDALLGTGVRGEVNEKYRAAIEFINRSGKPVLALDVPSGINATSGEICGAAVRATCSITFIALKQGLLTGDSLDYVGRLGFNSLNLPAAAYEKMTPSARRLDLAELIQQLPARRRNSHKGMFGHVLVVGGDHGMSGAVRLAGEAALRCGAGLVSVATRPGHAAGIGSDRPELMCHGVESAEALQPLLERATVVAVGPGLGRSDWSEMLWQAVQQSGKPLVMDADALNLLAAAPHSDAQWILTPHPGEAARLLDSANSRIQADRFLACRQLQDKYGGVVVLKGAGTIVSTDQESGVCCQGNPGMSSAGMGDVLTGVIAAMIAQGLPPAAAAQLGVCLHAEAADQDAAVAGERGMLAGDLMWPLRRLVNSAKLD